MEMTLPAFQGNFGSTEYWVATMKAGQLVKTLTIPKELDNWQDLTPEERFQREIDYSRVKKHIAPYLADDADRFIGAFIVAIHNHQDLVFEPLTELGLKFPKHMSPAIARQFGTLIFSGSEVLVPLDGQHRLAGLKFAIKGTDHQEKEIPGMKANQDVANDLCTLILIRNDPQKARKIFNKVNRYAKKTSKADDLITSDDDIIAVACREEITGPIIPTDLVSIGKQNTLGDKNKEFATLNTIYSISKSYIEKIVLDDGGVKRAPKVDTNRLPELGVQKAIRAALKSFWEDFLRIRVYESALHDPSPAGDLRRAELRKEVCINKPINMSALAEACFILLSQQHNGSPKFTMLDLVERIDQVDWSTSNPQWRGILLKVDGRRVITGPAEMMFASRVLAYMLGQDLEPKLLQKLKEQYEEQFDEGSKVALPDPIFAPG